MSSDAPILTKTEKNLWDAIVGEALAYLKYNAYAHQALEEGHPEVAQVFQEVAGAETIHGLVHLKAAGDIGTTAQNLRTVTVGESREFSTMYPRMIKDALEEGRQDAADSFALAMEREQHHLEMFTTTLERLEQKEAGALARETGEAEPPRGDVPQPEAAAAPPAPEPSGAPESGGAAQGRGAAPSLNMETYVTAATEIDREKWRVASMGRLREVVFGAQDGLLSTVALVTSVAVAVGENATVLVAGLAAALAGMLSMATGAFLGSRAEQDVQRSEIAREAQELEENPAEELAELVVIFQREGRTYQEARQMADEISQDRDLWLRTLVEKELGISSDETTNPVKDALVMGASFILAALVPIVPYLFLEGALVIGVSVVAALLALFGLGMGKGRLVRQSPLLQGLEILIIGAASAGVGFVLGEVVPRLIG